MDWLLERQDYYWVFMEIHTVAVPLPTMDWFLDAPKSRQNRLMRWREMLIEPLTGQLADVF